MMHESEVELRRRGNPLAAARRLADAFRRMDDFRAFAAGLEAALAETQLFDRAALAVFDEKKGEEPPALPFPPSALSLPLTKENGGVIGMVSFAPEMGECGPDDLHLMGGLAELVSAMLAHVFRYEEHRCNLRMMRFLLDQAPVAIICFNREGRAVLDNAATRRIVEAGAETNWGLPRSWLEEAEVAPGAFHLEVRGRLYDVAVGSSPTFAEDGLRTLVFQDLTPEVERFRESFAREIYRCGWLGLPLTVAVIEAPRDAARLMRALARLRGLLSWPAESGPWDARTVAIVAPEMRLGLLVDKLRQAGDAFGERWELGIASLENRRIEPADLLDEARATRQKVGETLRCSLLLHDDYPAVNDMLEMILRDRFRLTKSQNYQDTLALLSRGHFDGLITEVDLSNGADAWQLARAARTAIPGIRTIFTSASVFSRQDEPGFAGEIVIRKPFDVAELRSVVGRLFACSN
jgi:hypothetical protein